MLDNLSPEQRALATYMSELSEQAWYAQWMKGLEFALWHAINQEPHSCGRIQLSNKEMQKLRELSLQCGGWIRFDALEEEVFVPISEWALLAGRG